MKAEFHGGLLSNETNVSWDCKKCAYNKENILYGRVSLEG
jgi:hypothetical protein